MFDDERAIVHISIKDFFDTQDVDRMIQYLKNDKESSDPSKEEGRNVFLSSSIPDEQIKITMQNFNQYVMDYCENEYAKIIGTTFIQNRWIREPELIKWKFGAALPAHIDGPERIPMPDLTIGALVYLNDDYDGGEIRFPEYDITIKPKTADLIVFPCHFLHEVLPMTRPNAFRYTLPLFYTFKCEESDNVRL